MALQNKLKNRLLGILFPEEMGGTPAIAAPANRGIAPKDYGEQVASRKRNHKQYLRKHHLGKFRKK